MISKRSLVLAATVAMLSLPSVAVFAQDAAAPAATQNNNTNDDGGFDLGWLGLIGLAGLLGLRKRDDHRR